MARWKCKIEPRKQRDAVFAQVHRAYKYSAAIANRYGWIEAIKSGLRRIEAEQMAEYRYR